MENIKINFDKTLDFISKDEIMGYAVEAQNHIDSLINKTGKGNDFTGWVNLPTSITTKELNKIQKTAASLQKVEIVVVVGIGGSYLGAKAVNDALLNNFEFLQKTHKAPLMIFAGHNISEDYMSELLALLDKKSYAIVVISKSGTTTEPALAFRILKNHLQEKVGKKKATKLIIAITDSKKGALKQLATEEGYETYDIPDDVGGRYSVLTPVGLVPLAIAGFNIKQLVKGAQDMEKLTCDKKTKPEDNPASIYAASRNALYKKGKKIEIMVNYNNKLHFLAEWWKQLYGESEGKEGKGIYPASVDFSSDLHSMGQYIQEGERILFETVLSIKTPHFKVTVPKEKADLDNLNFLTGKRIDYINKMAELGTSIAHVDGGVPNIKIEIPKLNEYYLGQTMYFFEIACGISGYILNVNPFDQPGVEAYKKNMFALLEKPGFEEETKKIKARL